MLLRHLLYPVRAFKAKYAAICLPDLQAASERKNTSHYNELGAH